MDKFNDHFLG